MRRRSHISLWLPRGQYTQYKFYVLTCYTIYALVSQRVIQNVHFIPSPNMPALSHRKSAFPNISRDRCGFQNNYKSETRCVPLHDRKTALCFTVVHQKRIGEDGNGWQWCKAIHWRDVQSRRTGKIVTIWLSWLGGKSNENLKYAKEKSRPCCVLL